MKYFIVSFFIFICSFNVYAQDNNKVKVFNNLEYEVAKEWVKLPLGLKKMYANNTDLLAHEQWKMLRNSYCNPRYNGKNLYMGQGKAAENRILDCLIRFNEMRLGSMEYELKYYNQLLNSRHFKK